MKKTKSGFPIEIKKGSSRVVIYRSRSRGHSYFKLAYYLGNRRATEHFQTLADAKVAAKKKAENLNRGETKLATFKQADALIYSRAAAQLNGLDVALDTAAIDYAAARRILGAIPLLQAAEFYRRHHPASMPVKMVSEVVEEFQSACAGKSKRYQEDIRYRCGRFADAFECPIASVTGQDVQAFLDGLKATGRKGAAKQAVEIPDSAESHSAGKRSGKLSDRSRSNFRLSINTLVEFAKRKGYLSREHMEMKKVQTVDFEDGEIQIFSPEEASALLTHAKEDFLPFVAIGLFAGLRSAELCRLHWQEIRFESGFIEIKAGKSKTRSRRLIPIAPNLSKWLAPYRKHKGPLVPYLHAMGQLEDLARISSVTWKRNAMRHSYVTYRTAEIQNVNQVALEAGNSPNVIFKNYRELVTPQQAKEWFSILPAGGAENLISLPATAQA